MRMEREALENMQICKHEKEYEHSYGLIIFDFEGCYLI